MNDITRKVFYPSSLGVIGSIKAFIFIDGLAFCGHDRGSDGRGKKETKFGSRATSAFVRTSESRVKSES